MVWISTAPAHPSNLRPLRHSFSETEQLQFSIECGERNIGGEPLGADCFPKEIYGAPHARESNYGVPHLFFAGSYWVVSKAAADVLRQFDLGGGALYPVRFLKKDRQTPVAGEWYCLNFGNQKGVLVAGESQRLMDWPRERWHPPFVTKDGDIAVNQAAEAGSDIWVDPKIVRCFFLSEALGKALKKVKAANGFFLTKCRIVGVGH